MESIPNRLSKCGGFGTCINYCIECTVPGYCAQESAQESAQDTVCRKGAQAVTQCAQPRWTHTHKLESNDGDKKLFQKIEL